MHDGSLFTPLRLHQSLYYPLREEAVSTKLIIAVGSISAFLIACGAEYFNAEALPLRRKPPTLCGLIPIAAWLLRAVRVFLLYLLGFCVTVLLFELGKASTGVLRPNFMAVCRPNITCSEADPLEYQERKKHMNRDLLNASVG